MRSFTIIDFPANGKTYGRYKSDSPKRAAQKAFTQLSRMIDLKNSNKKNLLVFSIKETTNNSNNKQYKYVGTRVELHEPVVIKKNGKMIISLHHTIILLNEVKFNK